MPYILNKAPWNAGNISFEIKDGILFVERFIRMQYNYIDYKANVEKRLVYTEGFSYPLIVFGKDILSIDKEARGYMAGEGAANSLSRAFVIEQKQGKLPMQFFIETNKQPVPTKVFENMEEAIEWSKQFRILTE